MEVIGPIRQSLADEHVIGVDPKLKPDQPGVWRRRINAFTGRAVSDKALTAEQDMRSGLQRLHGMTMTAGVVDGLAITTDGLSIGNKPDEAWLRLSPGLGLARSGEDVTVGSSRRIRLGEVQVVVPRAMADALRSGDDAADLSTPRSTSSSARATGLGRLADDEPLAVRLMPELPHTVAMPLAEAVSKPAATQLPRAAILVAQPVRATIVGRPRDDCPPDPRDDPYSDLQRIDGCRLLLYFWPAEMVAREGGSDYAMPPRNAALRNVLAYRVFDVERSLQGDEMHPWEAWGVPLALVGFADDWKLEFIDRSAVVRKGGAPRNRTAMVPKSGNPQLWQARIEQLVEHLGTMPDLDPKSLRRAFPRIPPAGVLPGTSFDPATRRQRFFPGGFAVTAIPIPRSDLEIAVRGAASLIPYNMAVADQVELLIPVPDQLYEPGLLQTAVVDPAFAEAIEEFEGNRARHLGRRELVRRRFDRLSESVSGKPQSWPEIGSPPSELIAAGLLAPLNVARTRRFAAGATTRVHGVTTQATLTIAAGDTIWFWLKVHDGKTLTGLSLRLASPTNVPGVAPGAPVFGPGVYWGEPAKLPLAFEVTGLAGRDQGDVPESGSWIRLEVLADKPWLPLQANLVGKRISGIEFGQAGGDVEYGAFGKTDAVGNEIVWLADEAPGSGVFTSSVNGDSTGGWPWADVPEPDRGEIPDFGTSRVAEGRLVGAVESLKKEWNQTFLADDMKRLEEVGLDSYLAEVEAKIAATNDAVDVGFIRARSDIYRVRQFMLGADSASRLVTSPSLADLALRDEGARATSEGINKFIETARKRTADEFDFEAVPGRQLPPPPPPSPPLNNSLFLARTMTNNVTMASLRAGAISFVSPAPAPAPTATIATFAPAAIAATPLTTISSFAAMSASSALTLFQPATVAPATSITANRISLAATAYVPRDVRAQRPVPGLVERTISVAERLKPSPAVQALEYAIASKAAVLQTLRSLMEPRTLISRIFGRPPGVPLGDLGVPGFAIRAGLPPSTQAPTLATLFEDQKFEDVGQRKYVDLDVMIEKSDNKHESSYFTAAVNAIDNAIALMRLVEGRIALYESLTDRVRELRDDILGLAGNASVLLRQIDTELEEARHDIATAQMLLEEETARVDALNARRTAILADHVGAIGYRRIRECDTRAPVPLQDILSGLAEQPLAACQREHPDTPDELKRYTALLADSPVKWFPRVAAEVERIDRMEAAAEALEYSRRLATATQALAQESRAIQAHYAHYAHYGAARFMGSALQALHAQQQALIQRRLAKAQIDIAAQVRSLSELHGYLHDIATLSDLSAGKHRYPKLTSMASAEIAGFAEIGGCLHAGFAEVPPVVRLAWAEILSEFDRPADLSNLAGLPRWGELPRQERKNLQALVDYLFSRIDRNNANARDFVNDLVRVAMLLAAHSPVSRMIPARLVQEAPARIGSRLVLTVDTREARKGMVALIRDGKDRLISKAVIDDIGDGQVGARIVSTFIQVSTIVPSMRIELTAQVKKVV
ncbi:MAG TPA: hypothetical protein VI168_08060 [Croceibacterium sp.]